MGENKTYKLKDGVETGTIKLSTESINKTCHRNYFEVTDDGVYSVEEWTDGNGYGVGKQTLIIDKDTFCEVFEKYILDNESFYEKFKFKKLVKFILKKRVRK